MSSKLITPFYPQLFLVRERVLKSLRCVLESIGYVKRQTPVIGLQ